jgi:hypothetical protein
MKNWQRALAAALLAALGLTLTLALRASMLAERFGVPWGCAFLRLREISP